MAVFWPCLGVITVGDAMVLGYLPARLSFLTTSHGIYFLLRGRDVASKRGAAFRCISLHTLPIDHPALLGDNGGVVYSVASWTEPCIHRCVCSPRAREIMEPMEESGWLCFGALSVYIGQGRDLARGPHAMKRKLCSRDAPKSKGVRHVISTSPLAARVLAVTCMQHFPGTLRGPSCHRVKIAPHQRNTEGAAHQTNYARPSVSGKRSQGSDGGRDMLPIFVPVISLILNVL